MQRLDGDCPLLECIEVEEVANIQHERPDGFQVETR